MTYIGPTGELASSSPAYERQDVVATTTRAGLRVRSEIDEQMAQINLDRHDFHGDGGLTEFGEISAHRIIDSQPALLLERHHADTDQRLRL